MLNSVAFKTNDKILSRETGLLVASYDGTAWQGSLVSQGFTYARGYKVFFAGKAGSIIRQSGGAQLPVEDVVMSTGWNWIGHAPLKSYGINSGITTVGSEKFTADDQIKTRSGSNAEFTNYDGSMFQGSLSELKPGVGYEVRVQQAVRFRYTTSLQ